jgi:hypothetical protein
MHSERVEHLRTGSETNRLALLSDGKRRKKNGDDTVLAEWKTIVRMSSDLQNKMSIPAFEEKLARRRSSNWQTTENERARTESEILLSLFALQMDQLNSIELSAYLLRDLELESIRLNRRPIGQGSTSRGSCERSPRFL